jgi:fumarate hydratase subunit beta
MSEHDLRMPLKEQEMRSMRAGDTFYLTGEVYTIRDMAYERILCLMNSGEVLPFDLRGKAIWHCGPITNLEDKRWQPVSVGSTTSSRFTGPVSEVVEKLGIKLILGKGLLGKEALISLQKHAAVYAVTTGGAGAYYATKIEQGQAVYWTDLGMPSAVWVFKVNRLGPLIVAIDSIGGNIFEEIRCKFDTSLSVIYSEFKIDPDHKYLWWPQEGFERLDWEGIVRSLSITGDPSGWDREEAFLFPIWATLIQRSTMN